MSPVAPGRKEASTTTCAPWLAASIGADAAPASRLTPSLNGPAAQTTTRPSARSSAPLSLSTAVTLRPFTAVTGAWFTRNAPASAAVRAIWISRRASSNCPSW